MIQTLRDNKGWEFQFFGANIDSFGEAQNIGLKAEQADNWNYNKAGVNEMMDKMSYKSSEFRKRKF